MTSPTITILQSTIPYAVKEGVLWFPIIPISDALKVDSKNQFRKVKKNALLRPYARVLTLYIRGIQRRRYLCLPQERVLMWIAQVKSKSQKTIKLQNILADAISEACSKEYRHLLDLLEFQKSLIRIHELEKELSNNKDYQNLKEAEARIKKCDQKILDLAAGLAIQNSPS